MSMLDNRRTTRNRIYLSCRVFFLENKLHLYFLTGSEAILSWVRPRLCVPIASPNSSNSCHKGQISEFSINIKGNKNDWKVYQVVSMLFNNTFLLSL